MNRATPYQTALLGVSARQEGHPETFRQIGKTSALGAFDQIDWDGMPSTKRNRLITALMEAGCLEMAEAFLARVNPKKGTKQIESTSWNGAPHPAVAHLWMTGRNISDPLVGMLDALETIFRMGELPPELENPPHTNALLESLFTLAQNTQDNPQAQAALMGWVCSFCRNLPQALERRILDLVHPGHPEAFPILYKSQRTYVSLALVLMGPPGPAVGALTQLGIPSKPEGMSAHTAFHLYRKLTEGPDLAQVFTQRGLFYTGEWVRRAIKKDTKPKNTRHGLDLKDSPEALAKRAARALKRAAATN